jgi:hypothetical protein
MSANEFEEKFDEMLRQGLRKHKEAVPSDFNKRILRQIRERQEQKILARVILQERLALAGCIALAVITIVLAAAFPNISIIFTKQIGEVIDKIGPAIIAISNRWQLYMMVFAGVFGFAVYSFMDLLVSDNG